jgi:hypothetical protein
MAHELGDSASGYDRDKLKFLQSLFYFVIFVMLRLHQNRPLFGVNLFLCVYFDVPIPSLK